MEIEDEQDDYVDEREDLLGALKRNNKTLKSLVTLIDDTFDECIFSIRKEFTNFDNSWLPTEEFPLEAASHFIKFIGYNTVVTQDVKGTIYYLHGTTLQLLFKTKSQIKLMDAFGNKEYICLALNNKKI